MGFIAQSICETLWPTRCALCDTPGKLLCPQCARSLEFIDYYRACPRCGSPWGSLQCDRCNPVTERELADVSPCVSCPSGENIQRQRRAAAGGCVGLLPHRRGRPRLEGMGPGRFLHSRDDQSTAQARVRPHGARRTELLAHDGSTVRADARRMQSGRPENFEPTRKNCQHAGKIPGDRGARP